MADRGGQEGLEEEEQEAVVLGGNGGRAAVPESQEGRRRVGHQACFSGWAAAGGQMSAAHAGWELGSQPECAADLRQQTCML